MKIIETVVSLQEELGLNAKDRKVGFVPTMGALHEGHGSLIKRAREENNIVVCSIFVNPTQFNEQKDLINYPRTLKKDAFLAEKQGCDLLFVPSVKEIYPAEIPKMLDIDFDGLEKSMEGIFRTGHFNGMATVVNRLLEIVKPDNAYFGEKDFQQLLIVKRLVEMKGLPVNIIACPTIREPDGLAMSSRNVHLSMEEREEAKLISKVLFEARDDAGHGKTAVEIKQKAINKLKKSRMMELDYFEIVHPTTLQALNDNEKVDGARACIAVRIGNTRLIDNIGL